MSYRFWKLLAQRLIQAINQVFWSILRGVRILLTRCNRIVHNIWHHVLWQHQDYLTLLIGSDDLTLSKRAPPLTIARLQKFFSSDFDLLFFSNSWSPEAIKKNGHLRQVPRVATDPATTPVLRPLSLKTSDRTMNRKEFEYIDTYVFSVKYSTYFFAELQSGTP